jgi:hypothetical protein
MLSYLIPGLKSVVCATSPSLGQLVGKSILDVLLINAPNKNVLMVHSSLFYKMLQFPNGYV